MTKGHCESSLGSFDELQNSAQVAVGPKPSQLTWAVSPPVGSYRLQPPSPFIIYSFIIKEDVCWFMSRRMKCAVGK